MANVLVDLFYKSKYHVKRKQDSVHAMTLCAISTVQHQAQATTIDWDKVISDFVSGYGLSEDTFWELGVNVINQRVWLSCHFDPEFKDEEEATKSWTVSASVSISLALTLLTYMCILATGVR